METKTRFYCDCGCPENRAGCVYLPMTSCNECGDLTSLCYMGQSGLCFTCRELETIRRYRLHNHIEEN